MRPAASCVRKRWCCRERNECSMEARTPGSKCRILSCGQTLRDRSALELCQHGRSAGTGRIAGTGPDARASIAPRVPIDFCADLAGFRELAELHRGPSNWSWVRSLLQPWCELGASDWVPDYRQRSDSHPANGVMPGSGRARPPRHVFFAGCTEFSRHLGPADCLESADDQPVNCTRIRAISRHGYGMRTGWRRGSRRFDRDV